MRARRLAVAAIALVVVAATLAHDAIAGGIGHARSPLVLAGGLALGAALVVLVPRIGSWPLAVGAGLAAGGAVATAVSGLAWSGGVPDPIVRGGIAFNLADVAIAVGDALLLVGALAHGWVNRARLRQPV